MIASFSRTSVSSGCCSRCLTYSAASLAGSVSPGIKCSDESSSPMFFTPSGTRHRLPVVRRQQDFFRAAQMRDALRRLRRERRVRKPRDDFFQHRARRIRVLRQFQMPVRQLRERGGHLQRRRIRPLAKMVERDFRPRQILQCPPPGCWRAASRPRNHWGISRAARGRPRWPRTDGSISVSRWRRNNSGFGFNLFLAAVVKRANWVGNQVNDAVPPRDRHRNATEQRSG